MIVLLTLCQALPDGASNEKGELHCMVSVRDDVPVFMLNLLSA